MKILENVQSSNSKNDEKLYNELGFDRRRTSVHAVLMRLKDKFPVGQPQSGLHFLADGHNGVGLDGIRQPDGNLVDFATDVDYSTVDNAATVAKSFTDQAHHDLQPNAV